MELLTPTLLEVQNATESTDPLEVPVPHVVDAGNTEPCKCNTARTCILDRLGKFFILENSTSQVPEKVLLLIKLRFATLMLLSTLPLVSLPFYTKFHAVR